MALPGPRLALAAPSASHLTSPLASRLQVGVLISRASGLFVTVSRPTLLSLVALQVALLVLFAADAAAQLWVGYTLGERALSLTRRTRQQLARPGLTLSPRGSLLSRLVQVRPRFSSVWSAGCSTCRPSSQSTESCQPTSEKPPSPRARAPTSHQTLDLPRAPPSVRVCSPSAPSAHGHATHMLCADAAIRRACSRGS